MSKKISLSCYVKKLVFADKVDTDGVIHNVKPYTHYLALNEDGEAIVICNEGVANFTDKSEKQNTVEVPFYINSDNAVSIIPTMYPEFTVSELTLMSVGEGIPLHTLLRDHPRVNNNYNQIIKYMKTHKYKTFSIEETADV